MKKISVLIVFAMVTFFVASCMEVKRPGLTARVIDPRVTKTLADPKADYTNGVAPAIAQILPKNPNATVIISKNGDVTYIGDNGNGGQQMGIFENHAKHGILVRVYRDGEEKLSFEVTPRGYKRLFLLPGEYGLKVMAPDLVTILAEGDFSVDAIGADNFSEYANMRVGFIRQYYPVR
ncbi:MAG: hypothetical protein PHC97_00630 [Patescibacteria group bacterium]|nr:hypothetical protein [Patescibacteria group bacterium]